MTCHSLCNFLEFFFRGRLDEKLAGNIMQNLFEDVSKFIMQQKCTNKRKPKRSCFFHVLLIKSDTIVCIRCVVESIYILLFIKHVGVGYYF